MEKRVNEIGSRGGRAAKTVQIMAIINTSPDSFSGDGVDVNDKNSLTHTLQTALDDGADIVREHDVKSAVQTRIIIEALMSARKVMP